MQQTKEEVFMAKAKKGDYLSCDECGLVVVVDEACGCATAEVTCCGEPMASGKAAANRATTMAPPEQQGHNDGPGDRIPRGEM